MAAPSNPFESHVRHLSGVIPNPDLIFNLLQDIDWYHFPLRKGKNSSRTLCCHNIQELDVGIILNQWLLSFFKNLNIKVEILGMFGNYYPDGNATLPYHQDQYSSDVISLSFGSKRLFNFKTGWNGTVVKPSFHLCNGDMIIFDEYMNKNYYHGIPLQKQIMEPRINITCFVKFSAYKNEINPFTVDIDLTEIPALSIDSTDDEKLSEEIGTLSL